MVNFIKNYITVSSSCFISVDYNLLNRARIIAASINGSSIDTKKNVPVYEEVEIDDSKKCTTVSKAEEPLEVAEEENQYSACLILR